MVCDSCQTDINEYTGYKCSAGCAFAVCKMCAECPSRHLLAGANGKPEKFDSVGCDRCANKNLVTDDVYWYCEDCNFALCGTCVPAND